ncbi:uncharacterized protein SAMN04487775_10388 [Treponema bryantii]|jgi:uncharacterized protein|uniref:HD/PDEase domain-containing protein n=1 Tax=Treponema bryantii TaxID=163 RepID=A0A1I3JL22_9SPIR|nr:HD domain-containing protein [Treponema bryantii]SFI60698.1 uncharacterized protein SAMN04487775_10388 [Treponema bryantii]
MKTIDFVRRHVERLERNGRFSLQKGFIQHGVCSVYDHSVQVAVLSVSLTRCLRLPVNYNILVRAALLHDYFLYDWHLPHGKLHGFFHPRVALENARKDFLLSIREENTILRHMFPLTPIPPKFLEGWIVCICDKICAIREVFKRKVHN